MYSFPDSSLMTGPFLKSHHEKTSIVTGDASAHAGQKRMSHKGHLLVGLVSHVAVSQN
ncbi:hypothetical protein [Shouchella lonarensis]|uniref:hypothetical protein n=1 Tax=Shouchella lonarensis TaxID=1464122 RepID=UPI0015A0DC02|nr:hypothetical protein [Shouchella lonarensis]